MKRITFTLLSKNLASRSSALITISLTKPAWLANRISVVEEPGYKLMGKLAHVLKDY